MDAEILSGLKRLPEDSTVSRLCGSGADPKATAASSKTRLDLIPPPRTKEWLAVYHAVLREFRDCDTGDGKMQEVAAKAADKLVANQKAEDDQAKRPK